MHVRTQAFTEVELTNFKVVKNNVFYCISSHLNIKRLDFFSQLQFPYCQHTAMHDDHVL